MEKGESSIATTELKEVFEQLENLKIIEVEKGRIVEIEDDNIEEQDRDFQNSIACKILSNREISEEFFIGFMPKIWSLERRVQIEKAGRNTFLCKFRNQKDKNRAAKGDLGVLIMLSLSLKSQKGTTASPRWNSGMCPFGSTSTTY